MVIYYCHRCSYSTNRKSDLHNHLNRKRPCEMIKNTNQNSHDEITVTPNDTQIAPNDTLPTPNDTIHYNQCKYCGQTFTRRYRLHVHEEERCKLRNDHIRLLEIKLDIPYKKEEELVCRYCDKLFTCKRSKTRHNSKGCRAQDEYKEKLEKQLERTKQKQTVIQNITNNITNNGPVNNGTVNNIVSFNDMHKRDSNGFPIISSLDYCHMMEIAHAEDMVEEDVCSKFLKLKHFNPEYPEHQNIRVTDKNRDCVSTFENGVWVSRPRAGPMMEIVSNFIQVMKVVFQEYGYNIHEIDSENDSVSLDDRLKKFVYDYKKWAHDSTKDHHKYFHLLLYSLCSDYIKQQ